MSYQPVFHMVLTEGLTWLVLKDILGYYLLYSPKLDAIFFVDHVLFFQTRGGNTFFFVNRPFSNWAKISNSLSNHSQLQYHHESLQDADILKSTIENPESRIECDDQ